MQVSDLTIVTEDISIHTPLAGSDMTLENAFQTPSNFNPHSPCGERPNADM